MLRNFSVLFLAILVISGCGKNKRDGSSLKESESFVSENSGVDYKRQPLMVEGGGLSNLDIEWKTGENLANPQVSWEYFDELYHPSMSKAEKQYLGYLILSSKDLIGLATKNTGDSRLQAKLNFYLKELIDTEYRGYCVLYNGLKIAPEGQWKNEMVNKILAYAHKDDFSKSSKEALLSSKNLSPKQIGQLQRISENYEYVAQVEDLKIEYK